MAVADIFSVQDRLARLLNFRDYDEFNELYRDMRKAMRQAGYTYGKPKHIDERRTYKVLCAIKRNRDSAQDGETKIEYKEAQLPEHIPVSMAVCPDGERIDKLANESGIDARLLHALLNKVKSVNEVRKLVYLDERVALEEQSLTTSVCLTQ